MKSYLFSALTLCLILAGSIAHSQDIIRKKNKEEIKAKVLEIGIDEIKYRPFNMSDAPVIVIPKEEVFEIIFENGSTYKVSPDPYSLNQEMDVRNKTHKIAIEFFQPIRNTIGFAYESMLKVGTNLEFKAGYIGVGTVKNDDNPSGAYLKVGVKFLKTPDQYVKGGKILHPLKGSYIKPEFIFNSYTTNFTTYYFQGSPSIERVSYQNYALNIVFGKQLLLGNAVSFDYYAGVGYGIQNESRHAIVSSPYYSNEDMPSAVYSHTYLGKRFPMILSAGLTIGYIF